MKRSSEPFWWALFGAGGALAALFLPILVFVQGIAVPLAWVEAPSYESLYQALNSPITKLFLLVLIALSLFHWAHRFRFTLYDGLQVKHLNELIAIFCYGSAIAGSLSAGYFLFTL